MDTEQLKKIQSERRKLTIGEITDQLISGELRRSISASKEDFSGVIGIRRQALASYEGLETTPVMKTILNTATAFRFRVIFPECTAVEVVPRRRVKKDGAL